VLKGPSRNDTESDFSAFKGDNKAFGRLTDFFFEVLKQFSGVGSLLDIDSLRFGLENAVLVNEYEPHLI
jgi:hypothetical protein